ncbi:MAG: NAD(+) diphosphatase [Congregibacter sp.]
MLDLEQSPPETRLGSLHLVFSRGKLLVDLRSGQPCFVARDELDDNGWSAEREQFVGFWKGDAFFAIEAGALQDLDPMRYQLCSLYELLGRVDDSLFSLTGRAAQLLSWERDHQFCGRCGTAMRVATHERALSCEPCDTLLYPRIAPCVIVLVTRGPELLLARNAKFPRPMYSTLAGFIEAGENVEETLRREVREEVSVDVGNIQYFGSQAWPFPNQLMLGYFAEYQSGEVTPDNDEIAEAGWYHPDSLPPVPPPASIAGRLIQHHCKMHGVR